MYDTVEVLKDAYTKLLELGNWSGRHSREGQALLCRLRDTIAQETGMDAQAVHAEAESEATRRKYGVA